jgi:pilus assembly protein Flp/PilA
MKNLLLKFQRDEDGAAMVEYAIILGIITAGVIATVITIGGKVSSAFQAVVTAWT